MSYLMKNPGAADLAQRTQRLTIPFAIVHNATPASKTNSNDLPSCMTLSLEGQTATATALDSGTNFTTPVDSTGIFGVLLTNLGTVEKVVEVNTYGLSTGTAALSLKGASSTGVTASGNVAISVDWSGDLSATDLSGSLIVGYRISKN